VVSKPGEYCGGATGWADAAVIVPWTIYRMYGDERILEEQYQSMAAWIANMRRRAGDDLILREGEHFGDWLSYRSNDHRRPSGPTDPEMLATAFFAYSTGLVADVARILNRISDVAAYDALANRVREAFIREFITPSGRLSPNTQTAYVLALAFDLVPDEMKASAANRLVEEIRRFDNHLTTGFLGTPLLLHVLSAVGRDDVAYDLLMQDTYPSWLYPVKRGATTIWEHWDGIKPDGSPQDPEMNSYNHYAYGAVGSWLYGRVAGIRPDTSMPGFKHVIIEPIPGGGLTWATGELETMYGLVRSSWKIDEGRFHLDVRIPPNATGTVVLPCSNPEDIMESGNSLADAGCVTVLGASGNRVSMRIEPGEYEFATPILGR
jgi:alpha-L-rhamnosidase